MNGHADFADRGKDLVCAGVSAVAFGSLNALMKLTGIEPEIEQSEGGFLKCTLPGNLSEKEEEQAQLLLEGMIVSLETIEQDYSQYIQLTFQK